MKIRTDFVTNSSSSSFVTITIQGNDLDLGFELEDWGSVDMYERAFFEAKTTEELIEALCDSLSIDPPEDEPDEFEDEPDEFMELMKQLRKVPLDKIDAVGVSTMDMNRGEFVEARVDGKVFTKYEETEDGDEVKVEVKDVDPDDVDYVQTNNETVLSLKLKISLMSTDIDVYMNDDAELSGSGYQTSSVIVPEEVTVLEPNAFGFSALSGDLEKITFLGKLESIGKGAFKNCDSLRMIVAPKTPLSKFCGEDKEKAILGFASCYKKKKSYKYDPKVQAGYWKYIREHREKLEPLAQQNPALQTVLKEAEA